MTILSMVIRWFQVYNDAYLKILATYKHAMCNSIYSLALWWLIFLDNCATPLNKFQFKIWYFLEARYIE